MSYITRTDANLFLGTGVVSGVLSYGGTSVSEHDDVFALLADNASGFIDSILTAAGYTGCPLDSPPAVVKHWTLLKFTEISFSRANKPIPQNIANSINAAEGEMNLLLNNKLKLPGVVAGSIGTATGGHKITSPDKVFTFRSLSRF